MYVEDIINAQSDKLLCSNYQSSLAVLTYVFALVHNGLLVHKRVGQ